MQLKTPELLAPAGSIESAIAAIKAGANALYLGGKNFSARSNAQNFTNDELVSIIEYAIVRNVHIYIAVNTLYKNAEIPQVLEFVNLMHQEGAAAFILQDPGLAYILKTQYPQIEIHASTQMSVHSTKGVHFMKSMGFSRVVLSRELSLAEVAEITAATDLECEVFVHGALCVSYSGQCLMSSLIGGRSGNRGKCAQICRTKFELVDNRGRASASGYLLSPKDIMTLEILQDIAAVGVSSLKIEGRMKSPEYVYLVTKAYREKLDKLELPTNESTLQNVLQIFNRGGSFSTGYYNMHSGADMMSTVTPKSTGILVGTVTEYKNSRCKIKFVKGVNSGDGIEIWAANGKHVGMGISKQIDAGAVAEFTIKGAIAKGDPVYKSHDNRLVSATKKEIAASEKKVNVYGKIEATAGEAIKLTLRTGNESVVTTGEVVEIAQRISMPKEDILLQLSKTGNTPFIINFTHINIDNNIFVGKAELNQLRRNAITQLEMAIIRGIKKDTLRHITTEQKCIQTCQPHNLSVQIGNIDSLQAVLSQDVSRVYVDYNAISQMQFPGTEKKYDTEIFATLPLISRNATEEALLSIIPELERTTIDGYLVSTYGQLNMLTSLPTKKKIQLNHTFNIFNSHGVEYFAGMGMGVTLSQELNLHEINSINTACFELIVYGRQVLMCTHNCPIGIFDSQEQSAFAHAFRTDQFSSSKKNYECNRTAFKKGYALRDKMGMNFPIQTDCRNCIAYILNCKTLDTAPKFNALKNVGAEYFRLIFTEENETTIINTILRYKSAIGKQIENKAITALNDTTYGHFFRGVE